MSAELARHIEDYCETADQPSEKAKTPVSSLTPKQRARVEKWRWIIKRQLASGMSEAQYCRTFGFHHRQFFRGKQYVAAIDVPPPGRPTTVTEELFKIFWGYWAQESQPSLNRCWQRTYGDASLLPGFDKDTFPSKHAFARYLVKNIPRTTRYLVRNGFTKFRAKYGYDIKRSYDNMLAGTVWVSDHAQIDVMVRCPDGKVRVPWLTAWMDVKSYKFLGWRHHLEDPNSDHIALAFKDAALKYGIPSDVILDNGKDYLCRDIAGGRRKVRIPELEDNRKSIMGGLGITTHFAAPYNARAKQIERQFRELNSGFSRFTPGYRGPYTAKKPERLRSEIKRDEILSWKEYCEKLDRYLTNIRPHEQCHGQSHKGRTLEMVWVDEYPKACQAGQVRFVQPQALALFCRKAITAKIGRNGIRYGALDCWYWGEWMYARTGETVDLWLDREDVSEPAWVMAAGTVDQYLGEARAVVRQAALARTEDEKVGLGLAIKAQRKYYSDVRDSAPESPLQNIDAAFDAQKRFNALHHGEISAPDGAEVNRTAVSLTPMDISIRAREQAKAREDFDPLPYLPTYEPREERVNLAEKMIFDIGESEAALYESRKAASG